MNKTILIVDDHEMMREGIKSWISKNTEWTITAAAGDSESALSLLSENSAKNELPEIAIVDVDLGKESGFDLIKQMKDLYPELKIIMYSMHDEEGYILNARSAGAMGYISKASDSSEFKKCIEAVSAGQTYLEKALVSKNDRLSELIDYLTKKEQLVLQELLKNKNNEEISQTMNVSTHTVEVYVSKIYDKLGVHSRDELMEMFG